LVHFSIRKDADLKNLSMLTIQNVADRQKENNKKTHRYKPNTLFRSAQNLKLFNCLDFKIV